jgi:hypothetical protein
VLTSAQLIGNASLAAGTLVQVMGESIGYALYVGGSLIAFVPNEIAPRADPPVVSRRGVEVAMLRAAALALALYAGGALARRRLQRDPPTAESVRKGCSSRSRRSRTLDASGERLALIGRVGSDLTRHNLRYSHMAIVWRDHPKGRWSVVHMLNKCGTATSALYDEGLGNFFNDDPFAYDALLLFPSAASIRSA